MKPLLMMALLLTSASAQAAKTAKKLSLFAQGQQAMDDIEFAQAAKLFKQALSELKPSEMGRSPELDTREALVLALFQSGQQDEAAKEYRALKDRFPAFQFVADRVAPETVAAIEQRARSVQPATSPSLAKTASAPFAQPPRLVQQTQTPPGRWHWYYLAPLGIGQFAAHSPVRGTIFAVLQVGLIVSNIALATAFGSLVAKDGATSDPARGFALQVAMNVTFFAAIGAVIAGAIDGAAFEP